MDKKSSYKRDRCGYFESSLHKLQSGTISIGWCFLTTQLQMPRNDIILLLTTDLLFQLLRMPLSNSLILKPDHYPRKHILAISVNIFKTTIFTLFSLYFFIINLFLVDINFCENIGCHSIFLLGIFYKIY